MSRPRQSKRGRETTPDPLMDLLEVGGVQIPRDAPGAGAFLRLRADYTHGSLLGEARRDRCVWNLGGLGRRIPDDG